MWKRACDATAAWLDARPPASVFATPLVLAFYLARPLAAVRALSGARQRPGH